MAKNIIEILLIILVALGISKIRESIKTYGVVESVKRFFQSVVACVKWVAALLYKLPFVGGLFMGVGKLIGWAWSLAQKIFGYTLNVVSSLLKKVINWAVANTKAVE